MQFGIFSTQHVCEIRQNVRLQEAAGGDQGCSEKPEQDHRNKLLSYSRGTILSLYVDFQIFAVIIFYFTSSIKPVTHNLNSYLWLDQENWA